MYSSMASIPKNRTRSFSTMVAVLVLLVFTGATPSHANLITNGGFEDGNLNGWTTSDPGWTSIVAGGNTGQYAVALASNGQIGTLSQDFATIPGEVYQLSYFLYNSGNSGQGTNLFEAALNGSALPGLVNIPYLPYTGFDFIFTGISPITTLSFNERNDYPGNFYLDDVSVAPVPEPCTIFLLGSGLMAFGLRKKMLKS